MSWGLEFGEGFGRTSTKPATALKQEAAVVLAQGGAYQIYFTPTRSGWIDDRIVNVCGGVGAFCRERQEWSHRTQSVPEVGVLFSGRSLYRTANRPFGGWPTSAESPAIGAVEVLLACGYSVDLIPDWKAVDVAEQYPIIVLPDWKEIGEEVANTLVKYVDGGGSLLICGAENARLVSNLFGIQIAAKPEKRDFFVADASGFGEFGGDWLELNGSNASVGHAFRSADTRKDPIPLGISTEHGSGTAVLCPAPFCSAYVGGTLADFQ